MNKKEKACQGFTLIELVIVIGILGIMAAITIPRMINPQYKANKAARELMTDMHKARMGAIKTNQDWAIVFDSTADTYYICSDSGGDGVWSTVSDNNINKTVPFSGYGAGIKYCNGTATINASDGTATFPGNFNSYSNHASYPTINVLTFNPSGTCTAGYVYICYGDSSYAIGTLSTGLIRLKTWSGGAWR